MIYNLIAKIYKQINQLISVFCFLFIALATYFFIYWLLYNANVPLPDFFTNFSWAVIDFFTSFLKSNLKYAELLPVLPVLTCVIFIVLTYLLNLLSLFVDANQRMLKTIKDKNRLAIEKVINSRLHIDFINELHSYKFAVIKLKIGVIKKESYLSKIQDEQFDTVGYAGEIQKNILSEINSDLVVKKYSDGDTLNFYVSNLSLLNNFIADLVNVSALKINSASNEKLLIEFYCAIDLVKDINSIDAINMSLAKAIDLKIKNKLLVFPCFKVYFENIQPTHYNFFTSGEYNLSQNSDSIKNVMLYSITRKS